MNFDRRQLPATTGAVAALGALSSFSLQDKPVRKFKKAVGLGMVEGSGTLAEKFALLSECGFDGVELDSPSDLKTDELLAYSLIVTYKERGIDPRTYLRDTMIRLEEGTDPKTLTPAQWKQHYAAEVDERRNYVLARVLGQITG